MMQSKYKSVFITAIALTMALTLLTASVTYSQQADAQSTKKPTKPAKACNNVKIQVKVNGVEENMTYLGVVTLDGRTTSKMATAEANETSLTLPFNFKKFATCPELGSTYSGFVNATEFSGELKSIKKPNKVTVDLS